MRERAIDALGKTATRARSTPLFELAERDDAIGPLCVRALGQIGDWSAIEALCSLVTSERPETAAIEVVRGLSLANRSPEERAQLVVALAQAGRERDYRHSAQDGHPPPGRTGSGVARPPPAPISTRRSSFGRAATLASQPAADARTVAGRHGGRSQPRFGCGRRVAQGHRQAAQLLRFAGGHRAPGSLPQSYSTIGKGGFGTVYLVEDSAIQEDMILKILNPQLSIDDLIHRFVQELKLTRRITHTNVIRIHDLLDLGGAHAISMEYFPGRDLGTDPQDAAAA